MTDETAECSICMTPRPKDDFWSCAQCRNEHCFHCFVKIMKSVRQACPYCRASFINDETEDDSEQNLREIPLDVSNAIHDILAVFVRTPNTPWTPLL